MSKFAIDSNLYVRAFRDPQAAADLKAFYTAHAPRTYLCSVVLHELAIGAATPSVELWVEELAAPFARTRRLITPSHRAWSVAGHTVAHIATEFGRDRRTLPRSFINDILIAATCREAGVTLVTENDAAFRMIRRMLDFDFVTPWPDAPTA